MILKNYFFKPEFAFEFATSLETFLKIVQLPLEVSKVNAAHEFLDSHNVWQDSTFLNFLEVLTVAIFPLNVMFSFGSTTLSKEEYIKQYNSSLLKKYAEHVEKRNEPIK